MDEVNYYRGRRKRGKGRKGNGSGGINSPFTQWVRIRPFYSASNSICYGFRCTGGWQKDVVGVLEEKREKDWISVSFECKTLKAEIAAEEHIQKFMPKLAGMDAAVKIGPMSITRVDFEAEAEQEHSQQNT